MLRISFRCSRSGRLSLKYPSLVSYNKLPWETLSPDSPDLHQYLAPMYQHVLQLATSSGHIPRLVRTSRSLSPSAGGVLSAHPAYTTAERMQILPGMVYIMLQYPSSASPLDNVDGSPNGDENSPSTSSFLFPPPPGFVRHAVVQDSVSLQYYGQIHHQVGPLRMHGKDEGNDPGSGVFLLTSEDLQLLCVELSLRFPLHLPCLPGSSLDVALQASSLTSSVENNNPTQQPEEDHYNKERREPSLTPHPVKERATAKPKDSFVDQEDDAPTHHRHASNRINGTSKDHLPVAITLYHYFRPNRSRQELTKPLERLLALHRPIGEEALWWWSPTSTSSSTHFPSYLSMNTKNASFPGWKGVKDDENDWEPVLQPPNRSLSSPQSPVLATGNEVEGNLHRQKRPQKSYMPEYRPPTSYLMGLAERLAVRPGDCFGRRSLMWGHWY